MIAEPRSSGGGGEVGEAEKTKEHRGFAGPLRVGKASFFEEREDYAVGIAFEMIADAEQVFQAMPVAAASIRARKIDKMK